MSGLSHGADATSTGARSRVAVEEEALASSTTSPGACRGRHWRAIGFDYGAAGTTGSYPTKNGGSGNFASPAILYQGRVGVYLTVHSSGKAVSSRLSVMP